MPRDTSMHKWFAPDILVVRRERTEHVDEVLRTLPTIESHAVSRLAGMADSIAREECTT